MCLGFTVFCCSSAVLAFLKHHAAFGATEKRRGDPQKRASFF